MIDNPNAAATKVNNIIRPMPLKMPDSEPSMMGNWILYHMSRLMRKSAICICKNKGAGQLRGKPADDQRLCFRLTDSSIPLLP